MEKRVIFNERWLPYVLVAPQIVDHAGLLLLAGGQAIWQSVLLQDAFGGNTEFVWFENFAQLFNDPSYLDSFKVTAVFCVAGRGRSGSRISLLLAVMADRVIRGAPVYKTLLIWPYAVAPAVAGVLWLFLFNPVARHRRAGCCSGIGIDWNYVLNGNQAMLLVVIAAVWKQISYNFLFFLAGLQSIPKSLIEAAAIDGAGPGAALLDHRLPAAVADHASSCWWSTSSTPSSTPSASSTR